MPFPTITSLTVNTLPSIVSAFNRLMTQLGVFVDYINNKPQLDSINLTNLTLKAGNNTISHTLGKNLTGWTLTDQTATSLIYRYAPSTSTSLYLYSSEPTTVSITVF